MLENESGLQVRSCTLQHYMWANELCPPVWRQVRLVTRPPCSFWSWAGGDNQVFLKNSMTMTRLHQQAKSKTVSMIHLPYKVQGGVRKANGPTMQEVSRTSGFAPETMSKLLVLSSLWQVQLPLI